ncbi:MAG TPA: DUF6644 family protein [Caulobacteraceae bacterium]|nr:DUF6644 family protein [Caulobacteraceae bacterium]
MVQEFANWIQNTSLAQWIASSDTGFPWIETIHVICITTMVGAISVLDLRLLYAASKNRPVRQISAEVLPFTWAAFGLAAITGGLLFTSRAVEYVNDTPFKLKFLAMACAGLNMVLFHFTTYSGVDRWDMGPPPVNARISAGLSLAFWATVIICGRWIGFTVH